MDGANKRFMAGEANWLASHLIVYNVSQAGAYGNNPFQQGLGTIGTELPTFQFDLRKIGSIMNAGAQAKEYELVQLNQNRTNGSVRAVSTSTQPITAYFLPWSGNTTYRGRLGLNARYFFTPTLNGCTFVHEGGGNNPSVAHSNFVDPATTITDQAAIDADLAAVFGGAMPATNVIKTDYKPAGGAAMDYRAMVVGIRSGNSWNFYYQNYSIDLQGGKVVRAGLNLCVPI